MLVAGAFALAAMIFQSFNAPKHDLERFAEGNLEKLIVLDRPPPQPSRSIDGPDGIPIRLTIFRGQYVLLNVWATWCPPCVAEMPSLDQLQAAYDENFLKIVTVSMDRHRVDAERFFKTHDISHLDLYHDRTRGIAADIREHALPISIFYDPQGQEIARIPGEVDWQSPEVLRLMSALRAVN